jgi:hypothetical protein
MHRFCGIERPQGIHTLLKQLGMTPARSFPVDNQENTSVEKGYVTI